MITVGGVVIIGGSGGGGVPSGGTSGDALLGDGTWAALDEVVLDGTKLLLTGEPAGTALVSDGAGDVTTTSATVAAFNAAADEAAARAAIGLGVVYDFSSSAGWTAQGNNGTASITGGVGRLVCTTTPSFRTDAGFTYGGPALTRALPEATASVDVAVRIAVMASAVATSTAFLELGTAASAGTRRSIAVNDDLSVILYNNSANSVNATVAGAFASFTGEEWLRLRHRDGLLVAYTGVGVAGARPTTWTRRGSVASTTEWTHVALAMQIHTGAGTRTMEFDDLVVVLPVSP